MKSWLEKQRHILDFALASLWRRRAKNLALLVVYTALVFSVGVVLLVSQSLKQEAALLLGSTAEIIVQKLAAGRHDLMPLEYADKIKQIRGVAAVAPRHWGYYYDPFTRANYTLMSSDSLGLKEQEIIIGDGVARVLRAEKGRKVRVRTSTGRFVTYQIKGVLEPASSLVAADLILLSSQGWQEVFGLPAGVATDLVVSVRNPKEVPTVARKIVDLLPDTRPITREEILRTYEAIFDWRSGLLLVILAGATLAFVIFAWEKASGLSAEEQREIGILKALGWDTAEVLQWKTWEGLAVSLSAYLLGIIGAYIYVFFFGAPLFAAVLKGWSVLYPEFRLTPSFSVIPLVALFFLTVAPYTIGTIIPVWRAATLDPDLIMRS